MLCSLDTPNWGQGQIWLNNRYMEILNHAYPNGTPTEHDILFAFLSSGQTMRLWNIRFHMSCKETPIIIFYILGVVSKNRKRVYDTVPLRDILYINNITPGIIPMTLYILFMANALWKSATTACAGSGEQIRIIPKSAYQIRSVIFFNQLNCFQNRIYVL